MKYQEIIGVYKIKQINIIYQSVKEASEKLNKNINVLIKCLKSNDQNWKNYYYLPVEYINTSNYIYLN